MANTLWLSQIQGHSTSSSSTMASLVSNLSSTISRLTLTRNASIHLSVTSLQKLQRYCKLNTPTSPFLYTTSSLSSSRKAQTMIRASDQDEELLILGIETSCDDTAAALVRSNGEILSQVVSSQVGLETMIVLSCILAEFAGPSWRHKGQSVIGHTACCWDFVKYTMLKQACLNGHVLNSLSKADLLVRYGGVAPKMAEEAHSLVIDQVVQEALDKANVSEEDLSAVAVTIGPGLGLCLRVGVRKARKLAGAYALPIIGVHHMEAHALVARLVDRELQFPFLALLISGGHNILILARDLGHYIQLGASVDDAIGEAYDKTAKWLGLDLSKSGGPAVEDLAREGDEKSIPFKVPMKQHKDCNFSYAGLKTQVKLAIESKNIDATIPIGSASSEDRRDRADIAASFQRVAVLHLEDKCERAIGWALKMEPSLKHLVVSGGVASNQYVRSRLNEIVQKNGLQLVCPPPSLCTDNGVMIAWAGIEHFRMGRYDCPPPACEPDDALLDIRPRWPLGEEFEEGRSEARSLKTARIHPSLTSLIQAELSVQQQI